MSSYDVCSLSSLYSFATAVLSAVTNIAVNKGNNVGGGKGDDHHNHDHLSKENSFVLAQYDSGTMQTGKNV